jgi:hypothetical protein
MLTCRSVQIAAITFIAVICSVTSVCAQPRQIDELVTQNLEELRRGFAKLAGDVPHLEEKLRIIAEQSVTRPELVKIITPLAEYITAIEKSENQKLLLLNQLKYLACLNREENCELKRRLDELEFRMRQYENAGPSPTPAEPSERLRPVEPAPSVPSAEIWSGTVSHIVGRKEWLGPGAVLVARGACLTLADGTTYHGEVYRDGLGQHVLLKLAETRPQNVYLVPVW